MTATMVSAPGTASTAPEHGQAQQEVLDVADRICSIEGCENPHRARGWCNAHYQRWLKYGDPLGVPTRLTAACSIEGCENPLLARGWCNRHYMRWRRYGDPVGGLARLTTAQRFWVKVNRNGPGGCWLWMAAGSTEGYGTFWPTWSQKVLAHRWSYETLVGPIPDGLTLDHLCRVMACVRPGHLEPVTHRENVLRGVGPSAKNARKTHCIWGHEFSLENTYMHGTKRKCRECRRRHDAERPPRSV